MGTKDKKETILQKLQSTTDEQLIQEVYDVLNPRKKLRTFLWLIFRKNCKIK